MNKVQMSVSSATLFVLMLISPGIGYAATTPATPSAETSQSTKPTNNQSKPAAAETAEQRITRYKKTYALQVSAAEQEKLKTKCKIGQAKGKLLQTTVVEKSKARTLVYKEIVAKMDAIIIKLDDAEYNTKSLKLQRTELQKLISSYANDLTSYTNTLTDLNAIDCVTDPVGFKASLEAARVARAAVNKDAVAIRTYLETTIKKSLKDASTSLSTDKPVKKDTTKPEASTGDTQ
jgi:hypothetical protein